MVSCWRIPRWLDSKEERRGRPPRGDELMTKDRFFEETRKQSQVKAEIVEKYFYAWARIISATQDHDARPGSDKRIGYVVGATSSIVDVLRRAVGVGLTG